MNRLKKSEGSNQRFPANVAAILHSIHDYVFVLNKDRVVIESFQPASLSELIPVPTFLKRHISEVRLPAAITSEIETKLDLVEKTMTAQFAEFTTSTPEGLFVYRITIEGVYTGNTELQSFVIAVKDVTETVLQENKFLGILEKYNLAAKSASFGIWEFNYVTEEFYWDEMMENFFKCKISSVSEFRQVWLKLVQPGDFPRLLTIFKKALKAGEDFQAVFSVVVDGKFKYIQTFATFKYNRQTRRSEKVTGIALDITEKRLAEIALQKSEEHYRMLADNSSDIIILHQADGTVNYISPSAEKILGHTREETQKKGGIFYIHDDDISSVLQHNKDTLEGKESAVPYECRIRHTGGHWIPFEIVNKAVKDDSGNVIGILSISRDISARKIAEEHYRLLAENISDVVALVTLNGRFEYISPSVERLLGYTQQEAKTQSPFDIIHPDDVLPLKEHTIDKNLRGEEGSFTGYRVKHKNGHWVYFDVKSKPVYNSEGKITHILKSSRDVTDRVLAESASTEIRRQYKMLADNIVDLVVLLTPDFKRVYVSPSSTALTGYTPAEMLATTPSDIIHSCDKDYFYSTIKNTLFKDNEKVELSYYIRHKDGRLLFVESTVKGIYNAQGKLINLLATTRNITEKHNAEIAMRKSEEYYRILADNIVDLVVLLRPDFTRLYVSPSSLALTGYTPDEFMQTKIGNVVLPEDQPAFFATLNNTIFKGDEQVFVTTRIKHKAGHVVFVEAVMKGIRDDKGKLTNILSTIRNITRQHEAEEALRTSEEHYRMLADNIVDLVILLAPDFKRVYASPSCFALTGYTTEEFMQTTLEDIIYEDDLPAFLQSLKSTIFNGDDQVLLSTHIKHKTGRLIYVESIVKAIRNNAGELVNILSTIRNITKQHVAEAALRKSEELYRMLADNMFDMLILYGPYLQKLYVSPSCSHLTGYTPAEIIALPAGGLVYPDDKEFFTTNVLENAKAGKDRFVLEHRMAMKDGGCRYFSSVFSVVRGADGSILNIIVTSRDIHTEKMATLALARNEEQYRMLANNMLDMLVLTDAQFNRLYVSPSALHVTGYTAEELLANPGFDLIHPDDIESMRQQVLHAVHEGGKGFNCRFRGVHKSSRVMYMSAFIGFIRNDAGQLTNIMSTSRDITAEVNAQMALANSEEKYRSLVEASENIILVMDEYGTYLFANKLACQYVQKPLEEVLGKTIYDFFDRQTADDYVDKIKATLQSRAPVSFEYQLKVQDTLIYLRNTLNPIIDSNGNAYAVMLSLVDLTEIKNYAEKLRTQNEELKEIAYLQSHIVRAPLANMEGILNLIEETAMSAENLELLQMLKKSALQLDSVVNQVVQKAIHVKHQTEA
ncbi:MAG TPA: PAS domain S-box protein [Chitinophagaceae bacterium]|nr:PAS domain S-box protein [Chitinophagaceae bacterium]